MSSQYRTELKMREHLKPHKFREGKDLKTPMPPPKKVKKLEKLRSKGIDVEYPRTPWYTDNEDALKAEDVEKWRRINEAQHAEFLPKYPAPRHEGVGLDKPRIGRSDLEWKLRLNH